MSPAHRGARITSAYHKDVCGRHVRQRGVADVDRVVNLDLGRRQRRGDPEAVDTLLTVQFSGRHEIGLALVRRPRSRRPSRAGCRDIASRPRRHEARRALRSSIRLDGRDVRPRFGRRSSESPVARRTTRTLGRSRGRAGSSLARSARRPGRAFSWHSCERPCGPLRTPKRQTTLWGGYGYEKHQA